MQVIHTYARTLSTFTATGGPGDTVCEFAVLTQDTAGEFAVYRGAVPAAAIVEATLEAAGRDALAHAIAERGEKLGIERARAYFPHLSAEDYRH
jgi:hypothetical protein